MPDKVTKERRQEARRVAKESVAWYEKELQHVLSNMRLPQCLYKYAQPLDILIRFSITYEKDGVFRCCENRFGSSSVYDLREIDASQCVVLTLDHDTELFGIYSTYKGQEKRIAYAIHKGGRWYCCY